MKKFVNDKSPFSNSLDEMDGEVLSFEGHDRPRYIYPFNNEAGYLGLDDWSQYWNKATFSSEVVGKLDATKYYSIVVVPVKTDISVGGIPIYGEATAPSIPQKPTAELRGFVFNIPTHTQTVIKDCGIAYDTEDDAVTDEEQAWTVDEHIGKVLKNVEDETTATITANTATTITASGASFSSGDRYQITNISVKARLVYACEMASAASVNISYYYLAGVITDNTSTTFTMKSFVESADIWDFDAGFLAPPSASCVKNVSGVMFCGGGITEERGTAKIIKTIQAIEATATANEAVTVSVEDDDFDGAETSKIIRLTLGSALTTFDDIHEGSYISITGAANTENNVVNKRVTRVAADGTWLEFEHNDAVTNATYTISTPIVTGTGTGTVGTPVENSKAISESWELTCTGTADLFIPESIAYGGGNTGNGLLQTPTAEESAVAETWTLECTGIVEAFGASAPTRVGSANGAISVPILDPTYATEETWLLECTAVTTVFTAGTASKTGGTGDGTIYQPVAGTSAVAELWALECISTPKSYSNTTPSKTGTGNGVVSFFSLGASPTAGAWEVKCTTATTEKYISSVSGTWTAGYSGTPTANTSVQLVINSTYFSGSVSGWYVSGYTRVDSGSSVSFKLYNGYNSVSVGAGGMTFSIGKQSGGTSFNMNGTINIGTRASTGATFTATGPAGVTGTFLSGGGVYTNSSFSIAVSDGATRWAVNDKFTFTITETVLGGATFSVTGAVSGAKANLTTGAAWYNNNYFTIRVADGTTKWLVGAVIQFTITSAVGNNATFSVVGTTTGAKDALTSGINYDNGLFSMLVSDGTTKWQIGDTVTFDTTGTSQNGATFSVTGSVSNIQSSYPLTSGVSYTNNFFSCLLADGTTKWEIGDTVTFDMIATVGDGEVFSVYGERSGDQPQLVIGQAYSNDYFSLTIADDAVAWALNDKVFFSITKTPTELVDTSMQLFVNRNYVQGNVTFDPTYFSEGMKDGKFQFVADTTVPLQVSWVDSINQKIGLAGKYDGNNAAYADYKVVSDYPLYYSDSRNPHRIRSGSIIDVGDSVTGISSVGDNVLCFCRSSLWRISVESLGAAAVLISDNIRCPAQFSIVKGEKLVAFYDGTGISVTDGVTATSVTSYKTKDYLANINKAYEANIVGVYDRENRRFEFVFPMGDETLNNYGLYVTEGSWNCYPFSRPDCNFMWTNYDSGNLKVYHGTSGELADGNGSVWKHSSELDGINTAGVAIDSISGQDIVIFADAELTLTAGDSCTIYPIVSGEEYKELIIESATEISTNVYRLSFDSTIDLTAYEAGDMLYFGYIPFDYGIKWTDFSSPQYRHQPRSLHIDIENLTGKLYVDHFLDMSETAVVTNEYSSPITDNKIVVPFRMGKCYKYGFRLRGITSTQMKISAFEIMFDTIA